MFKRQTTGSVVCTSCGNLVGVRDEKCFNCGRRNPGLWGFAPVLRSLGNDLGFVQVVIWACSVLYLLTLVWTLRIGGNIMGGGSPLNILAPDPEVTVRFGASGAAPVFLLGMWWTVLSAGWLHGSILHILFNMMWVKDLAPATADLYGAGRMVIIYTVGGAGGFVLSSLFGYYFPLPIFGAYLTLGASAPLFALLGALVYYGHRSGSSIVRGEAMRYAIILFAFGLFMRGVDNAAHLGGFVGGYVMGRLLDPLKPERIDHILGAVICLALVVLSIAASLLRTFAIS